MSNSSRVMSYLVSWLVGALAFVLGVKLLTAFFESRIFPENVAVWGWVAAISTLVMMGIAAAIAVLLAHSSVIEQGFLGWLLAGMPGVLAFSVFNIVKSALSEGFANSGLPIVYGLFSLGFAVLVTLVGSAVGGFIRRAMSSSRSG